MNEISTIKEKRVLVIDDDRGMCDLYALILTHGGGLRVKTTTNPLEGLEILKQEEFDLLICDIMMPSPDGYEVLEQIRADSRWDGMPILMCDALVAMNSEVPIRLFMLGADACEMKPFSPKEISELIQALLTEGPKQPDERARLAEDIKMKKKQG